MQNQSYLSPSYSGLSKVNFLSLALIALALLLTSNIQVSAQTPTATLSGAVHDQTGGTISKARVVLVQSETGSQRTAETNEAGQFTLSLLPSGTYSLTISFTGFKTEVIKDFRLAAGEKSSIELLLVPGPITESVEVFASASTLQPTNGTVGAVIDQRLVNGVPVPNRHFLELAVLLPGVAPAAPGSDLSTQASSAVNIGGAREASNNFLLDGVDNNDLFLNRFVVNPSLDSIREFTILENNYDAEYGRSAGGQIIVATKSGTSQLHGSAYEFFNHSGMDARNYFDLPGDTPHRRRNQFGGSIGGPFGGSQNFFFLNSEFDRAQQAETRTANVPTEQQRAGDFSGTSTIINDPFTGQPFSQNRIPAGRLDPVGTQYAALFPLPNRNAAGQNFVSSPLEIDRVGQATGRVDTSLPGGTPVFVRYSYINDDRTEPFGASGPNIPGFGDRVLDRGQDLALGATHLFSSALNEFRLGYNRLRREVSAENTINGLASFGATGPKLTDGDLGYARVTLAGYESLGDNPSLPILGHRETIHVSDSLSMQRGRHFIKTGFEARHYLSNGYTHLYSRGQIGFTGFLAGDALAELLLGMPTFSILAQNNNYQALRTHAIEGFLQDDWKLTRSVTVNLGVRYQYSSPPVDAHDSVSIFDLQQLKIRPVGKDGVSRSGIQSDYNNFAPRVGMSWDIGSRGRFVLRSGYGIFYDTEALIAASAWYYNPPVFDLNIFATGATLLQLSNPFPSGQGFSPLPAPVTLDPRTRIGYAQHWNLSLQTRLGQTTTVETRYVGTKGTSLFTKRNINQPAPGPGDVDSRRPIPGFSDIFLVEPSASSIYHALQIEVQKRPGKGLSLLASYTLSKSIDNTSAFIASTGDDNTPQNSSNLRLERGLSNFDVRNRLSLSATYDVPGWRGYRAFQGWHVTPLLTLQSGRPFTPRLSVDNSNTGNGQSINGHDRPDLLHNPVLSNPTPERYFDTTAFAKPAQYTFGNAGRNVLTGPAYAQVDLSLAKDLARISEQGRVALRADAFNLLNHPNFQLPDGFLDNPTFGSVLAAYPARQLQLALRLSF